MDEAFEIINKSGQAPVVLVCEHASNFIPDHMNNLGLALQDLASHIAWDPSALDVAKTLSRLLDCPLVAAKISRLVYDCNRAPDAPDAFPSKSEQYIIPGNKNLSEQEISWRIENVYQPFKKGLKKMVAKQIKRNGKPFLVTIHSFTPVYNGEMREVEIGVLHDRDSRLADVFLEHAKKELPYQIKRNEPYSPKDGVTHTLCEHGLKNDLPNMMIEIRNNLITDHDRAARMANDLFKIIGKAIDIFQKTDVQKVAE